MPPLGFPISRLCGGALVRLEFICARVHLYGIDHRQGDRAMSLHLVAGVDFPSRLPTAGAPFFLLGVNAAGQWVIRETTGRRAGLFRTRQAAIRYARDESADGNFTIVDRIEGLEFEQPSIKRGV
jgi:hypothetical protein